MTLNTTSELIHELSQGRMIVLMDDEDRENEGDIIVAADKITPEYVNFMATEARGLICLTLTGERCDFLGLPSMVSDNSTHFSTPFTVSIEAASGVTTGISAADRAHTIMTAVNNRSKPTDIVRPGHVFPLRAQPGGVLSRAGHTEAGCDLAKLAGFNPAAVIVEIMNTDGSMARRSDLEAFAKKHCLKIGTIANLIQYRMATEKTIQLIHTDTIKTTYGTFQLHRFYDAIQKDSHLALTLGDINYQVTQEPCLVRVQNIEILRDLLRTHKKNNHSWPIDQVLKKIAKEKSGILVLLSPDRTTPIADKIEEYFERIPIRPTISKDNSGQCITIGTGSQILAELGVKKMRLLSERIKYSGISGFDLEVVEYIPYDQEKI